MNIKYIDVFKNNKENIGDQLIQNSFLEEFREYELVFAGDNHMNGPIEKYDDKKIVMVSSDMLPIEVSKYKKGSWTAIEKFNNANILPLSIGAINTWKFDYEWKHIFEKKFLPFLPIVLIPTLITVPVAWAIQKSFFSKSRAKSLIRKAIDFDGPASVRSRKALEYLTSMGHKNVFFTGCVTTWSLPKSIREDRKSNGVVVSFTGESKTDILKIVRILKEKYDDVVVWDQTKSKKYSFISECKIIYGDWEEFSVFAKKYDYIGSRLHAGIFVLRNGGRAFFLAVDHRVREFSEKTKFKYINICDPKNPVKNYKNIQNWYEAISDANLNSRWMDELVTETDPVVEGYKTALVKYLKDKNSD